VRDLLRTYAGQEYMCPGAAETVGAIQAQLSDRNSRIVEVASGKGEAAATLADRTGCRVVCIETNGAFVRHSVAKFRRRNLFDSIHVVQADGRQLPLRSATVNGAYCIGAPSIVGLEPALREMARVVVEGGWVIVSDVIWRTRPGPLGLEWGWVGSAAQTTRHHYVATLNEAGLLVDEVVVHGRDAWERYWMPMRGIVDRAPIGGRDAFVIELEQHLILEHRAVDAWLDYATFITHKPSTRAGLDPG